MYVFKDYLRQIREKRWRPNEKKKSEMKKVAESFSADDDVDDDLPTGNVFWN